MKKKARKEEMVRICLTVEQKKTLTAAASAAGVSLSSWLLERGLRAVNDAT